MRMTRDGGDRTSVHSALCDRVIRTNGWPYLDITSDQENPRLGGVFCDEEEDKTEESV